MGLPIFSLHPPIWVLLTGYGNAGQGRPGNLLYEMVKFSSCYVTDLKIEIIFIPLRGISKNETRTKKRNDPKPKKETGGATNVVPLPGIKKGVLSVAEKKQTDKAADGTTKKNQVAAGTKKPKVGKPTVLTGTVPEWSSTTVIHQLLGKGVRRIQQLTQEGILETEIPPGGGARKYRTCETIQRYIAHIEQKAQETGENSRTAELNLKKLEAEVELKESQGQLHRLKTAIAEGNYISADQATEELTEFMAVFKKFAMNIPSRMAGTLSSYTDALTIRAIEKSMRKELETMLAAFVDAAALEQQKKQQEEEQS